MDNREEVIQAVKFCFSKDLGCVGCDGCIYQNKMNSNQTCSLGDDILALLNEVKPKTIVRHGAYGRTDFRCGDCMQVLYGKQKFCPNCGKKVRWNA